MTSFLSVAPLAPVAPLASPTSWITQTKGLILDLDGTLISGHEVLPGARELLERWHERYIVVSNNSTHTAQSLAQQLQAQGLPISASHLVLAGEQALRYIAQHYPRHTLLLCASTALHSLATELGMKLVTRDADMVLLTRDRQFSYETLQLLVEELSHGATLMVSNADLTHPGPEGLPTPETGALLQAVQACLPHIQARILGKPQSMLFEEGLKRLGLPLNEVTVIGDNAATDALGAVRLGLGYLLVGGSPHADAPNVGALLHTPSAVRRQLPATQPDQ